MSDLPLDETALQAAGLKVGEKINWVKGAEGEARARELARAAVSTYLREAGFVRAREVRTTERKEGHVWALSTVSYECQKSPWVPVVQAESEEE